MSRAAGLGGALGPVLLQLPPDMPAALDRLDATLAAFGPTVRVAVEPRHPSWFTEELRQLLEQRRAALCVIDRGGPKGPAWATTDWRYVRLHGGRAAPSSCYGRTALASWADRLRDWPSPSFVYFNNDGHGCAVRNATDMRRRLARR